ncbi:MAG: DUF1349 domain-containing protein [Clostridiales bacterium]|nr:DUF1349 domain-containing protein [Clostridiales bacterium]
MEFISKNNYWIHKPKQFEIDDRSVRIITEPNTDLWQRTYYGFRNDNAPALLLPVEEKFFSFTVKTVFDSRHRFDQCGVILYQNANHWLKASAEYENSEIQRLGSVVTNLGFSDWATTDIPAAQKWMYYRLSRRESDYCIECSYDGIAYQQMRICHLFAGASVVNVGVYACSPEASSFRADFTGIALTDCLWKAHQ